MSTTVSIPNFPTSYSDVSVTLPDATKLKDYDTGVSADKRSYWQRFLYAGTDISAPVLVTVKRSVGTRGQVRMELSIDTVEIVSDGIVSDVEKPVKFFIGFEVAEDGGHHDLTAFSKAMGFTYALTFLTVTSKVPDSPTLSLASRCPRHLLIDVKSFRRIRTPLPWGSQYLN
jgi:hypothetical protein